MDARGRTDAARDRDVEPEERGGKPDAPADAALQPLIGEPLSGVVYIVNDVVDRVDFKAEFPWPVECVY